MAQEIGVAQFEDEQVQEFLSDLKTRLRWVENGQAKYMGLLSAIVFRDILSHFDNEMGSSGPWSQWSPQYSEYLRKIGRAANGILQFSGKLRNNFMPSKVRKTSEGYEWYNNAKTANGFPYAEAHDEGTDKLPQREFMWLSDQGLEDISYNTLQFMMDEPTL